ncbi:Putative protein [Zobellia galactanivorans]|uniref:Uncharacterized protein n=1 Tax=Zobellia galactanivorans (strain DSM 12802 / CCUG 47099 / CIP 106680 / NCIMB 13871 / Dsij) TaxID=63186 RepID=G0LAY4_ZOBGA|nr:Putative protein [Zobellia galactanivorans]
MISETFKNASKLVKINQFLRIFVLKLSVFEI